MNFWLSVCGCQFGAFAFLGMLVAKVWSLTEVPAWTAGAIISTVMVPVLAAAATKLATIVLSRLAFGCELVALLWNADTPPAREIRRHS